MRVVNNRDCSLHLDDGVRASLYQQSTISMEVQSSLQSAVNQLRNAVEQNQFREVAETGINTKCSEIFYSSPTIDQQASGVKKTDVCHCHGTLEHGIFSRDTTPEYTAGDVCRPLSPSFFPIRCYQNHMVTAGSVKQMPRSHCSGNEDNNGGQYKRHVTAGAHQGPPIEHQGDQRLASHSSTQAECFQGRRRR